MYAYEHLAQVQNYESQSLDQLGGREPWWFYYEKNLTVVQVLGCCVSIQIKVAQVIDCFLRAALGQLFILRGSSTQ